jgi:hypothetical protein
MFICLSPHVPDLCIINPLGYEIPVNLCLVAGRLLACPTLSLSVCLSISLSLILHVLNVSRKGTVSRGFKAENKRSCLFTGAISVTELLYRVCQKENDYRQNDGDGGLL